MRAILDAGELGTIEHFEINFRDPTAARNDIRWRRISRAAG